MLGDVETIGHLVDGVFNIKNPFFIEIEHDLAILGVVRDVAVGIHLFNGELKRLRDEILDGRGKVNRRANIRRFWWNKGAHDLRERHIKVHVDAQQPNYTMLAVSNRDGF